MLFPGFSFDHYVINVYLYHVTDQRFEDFSHQPLVSGSSVLEPEWHNLVAIKSMQRYKGSLFFICQSHRNLMVSKESI